MNARIKGLWLIVECPHCLKPQVIQKYVLDNTVDVIIKPRYFSCEHCDGNCFIELKENDLVGV